MKSAEQGRDTAEEEVRAFAKEHGCASEIHTVECDLLSFASVRRCSAELERICATHADGCLDAADVRVALEKFLAPRGGSPIAVQIVPPFHKMIEIETKTRDLKYVQMMTMSAE